MLGKCATTEIPQLSFFVVVVLGFELRASHLLTGTPILSHSASPDSCWVFFKIRSRELFAPAGCEP
jgi:hypothetical protein